LSEGATRRGLLGAALMALGGCGFRPLYGDGAAAGDPDVAREFAATRVGLIPDRFGQLLRRSLQQRLSAGGPAAARWDLLVTPSFAAEGMGVQPDGAVTRVRYTATANWTLNRVTPRETVANGFERTMDAYNIQPSQFFSADMSREAMERRLAEQLADEVVTRLAMRLRNLQGGAAPRLIAPVATPPAAPEPMLPVRPIGGASPGLGGDLEGGIGPGLSR
jgi:LPS-assembly lipoprotein